MTSLTLLLDSISNSPAASNGLAAIGTILGAMVLVALIEAALPLHARGYWNRAHLASNLALTFITFAANFVFNTALVLTLVWLESIDFGLMHGFAFGSLLTVAIVVLALDFSTYVAHVAMHEIPGFWRYHRVHHADPAVDVTTTIRQHPGESVIRYAFMAVFAIAIGAGPAAFAVYRVWSALQGLIEHANIRLPMRLDTLLSFVITSPNMHKVHHSREARFTDTNFGNITSLWDRLFFTFTPAKHGANVDYGLDGCDEPAQQRLWGLLAMPYRAPGTALADELS